MSCEELPEIPGGWTEREIRVGDRDFPLTLPADPDAFLEGEAALAAFEQDEYLPYWAHLWPASIAMARVMRDVPIAPGTEILEIGAGLSLVGFAVAERGFPTTVSDYDDDAMRLARYNARRLELEHLRTAVLDWRQPPARQFPLIVGCELLYDLALHAPILRFLDAALAPGGVCLLGDSYRRHATTFQQTARNAGWRVTETEIPATSSSIRIRMIGLGCAQ